MILLVYPLRVLFVNTRKDREREQAKLRTVGVVSEYAEKSE